MAFDKTKYNKEYKKDKWKIFKADLKIEEYEEANNLLKENNLNKAEFIKLALKALKEHRL